ncbi:MAG: caspase family protein [Bacteroidota bacterium]
MDRKKTQKAAGFFDPPAVQNNPSAGGRSYFLGIGINRYNNFTDLNNAARDIECVAELLFEKYHFEQSLHTKLLLNEEATQDNIYSSIRHFYDDAIFTKNDRLLIYFSGHGYLDKRTDTGYWIPVDGRVNAPHSFISSHSIWGCVRVMPFKHILIISDSCFSGSLLVKGTRNVRGAIENWDRYKSRFVFSSGKEMVDDGEPGGNSPFTANILKQLQGNRKPLPVQKLALQVTEEVAFNHAQQAAIAPLFQTGHDGGQFIFFPKNQDKGIFQNALAQNTIEAYQKFIDEFPESPLRKEAEHKMKALQRAREEAAWGKAKQLNELEAWKTFCEEFPASTFTDKAKKAIARIQEENDWGEAKALDTFFAYQKFIRQHPDGEHIEEAKDKLQFFQDKKEKEEWDSIQASPSIAVIHRFLKKYPNSIYSAAAKKLKSRLTYEQALKACSSKRDYSRYLANKDNRFADLRNKALERLSVLEEQEDWARAKRIDTIVLYHKYLDKHPKGLHAAEANQRLHQLDPDAVDPLGREGRKILSVSVKDKEEPSKDIPSPLHGLMQDKEKASKWIKDRVFSKAMQLVRSSGRRLVLLLMLSSFLSVAAFFCMPFVKEYRAFHTAKQVNTIGGYESFIGRFPEGRFTAEASQRLGQLRGMLGTYLKIIDPMRGLEHYGELKRTLIKAIKIHPDTLALREELQLLDQKSYIETLLDISDIYEQLEAIDSVRSVVAKIRLLDPENKNIKKYEKYFTNESQ